MNVLTLLIGGIAFVVGISFIPLLAMVLKDSLPGALAEPLANLLATIGFFVVGDCTLHQTETGEYEIRPVEGAELEPKSYMNRFKLVDFGISFEATEEAFGSLVADVDAANYVDDSRFPFNAAEHDMDRGGKDWYVDLRETGLRVPIGEALSRLKGRQDLKMVTQTISEANKRHGGDTNNLTTTHQVVGFSLFTFVGIGMGVVIFL